MLIEVVTDATADPSRDTLYHHFCQITVADLHAFCRHPGETAAWRSDSVPIPCVMPINLYALAVVQIVGCIMLVRRTAANRRVVAEYNGGEGKCIASLHVVGIDAVLEHERETK